MDNSVASTRIRVLIADDDPAYGEVLDVSLSVCERIEVVGVAAGGAEAVELAVATRPDAIVMDINMPGMNGFEAARAVRAVLPGTRVFMNSAVDHAENRARAAEAGACEFLVKGLDVECVADALCALRAAAA
jgi:DNA-binding NarL/FixJ family response regulator